MELSKKIRELRSRDGFSQEELAERIYVTRQTISNWETERSYPDVQSLLLLSTLFAVSLDELVKGDVDMMRNTIDTYKMNVWAWIMLIAIVLAALSAVPLGLAFGVIGLIPCIILGAIGLAAAMVLEKIKKKHDIETYSEILAFMQDRQVDNNKVSLSRKHKYLATLVKVAAGALTGLILAGIGWAVAAAVGLQ